MPDLLLPGTRAFHRATTVIHGGRYMRPGHTVNALHTIMTLWHALRVLHAATVPSMSAVWQSEELRPIREAIEEEG